MEKTAMVLTKLKVPAVLLLEMTSAYMQVLLRVKGKPKSLVVQYMNHHNKIWTFILEFHIRSIAPFHSKDFQLLWTSYIGLHTLQTIYAFPLFINLSLVKYWRQKIIILETSNLPTRKLQPVNALHVWNKK